jgi:hypothetical protein
MMTIDYFKSLQKEDELLVRLADTTGAIGYFAQETIRFISLAGSIKETFPLKGETAVERYITHIIGRSLLEGFFWVLYIFDNNSKIKDRYAQKLDFFKREYGKLWNDNIDLIRNNLETADIMWHSLSRPPDVNTMIAQVKNDHGDRLNYLYPLYRVASFDTHGNSLNTLYRDVFGKQGDFPFLNWEYGFNLIAYEYLSTLTSLRDTGQI